jgi:hypothetical protein
MTTVSNVMTALLEKFGDSDGNINVPQDELVKAFKSMKTTGRRVRKNAKAPRDPDAPKRPTSSYMLWLNDNRKTIATDHFPVNDDGEHCYPDGHEKAGDPLQGRSKVSEITKKAGALWKQLDDDAKKPYAEAFTVAQTAYREAKGDYTPKEPKESFDTEARHDAPEDWTGPFECHYLIKVAKDPETGKNIKSFKSFDEAVVAANDLGDGCAGITMTARGYSLRVGPELKNHGVAGRSDGLASWTKGDKSEVEAKTPTPSPEPEEPKALKKATKETKAEAEAENDDTVVAPKKKRGRPAKKAAETDVADVVEAPKEKAKKAKKVVVKIVEPEPESDSEDDEIEVSQITIDGDDYFLNDVSGDIYDPETQEVVGKSEDGKHTLF